MLSEMRGLARESMIYGLATVLGRMLSFLLTPLYSHLLQPHDNGAMQAIYSLIALLSVVYGLGLDTAYLRLGKNHEHQDTAFTSALGAVVFAALCVTMILSLGATPLTGLIGIPAESSYLIHYAGWILAADAATLLPYADLRGSHRAGAYAAVKLAGIIINVVLALVFVRGMGLGLHGVFLANLVSSLSSLTMLSPVIASRWGHWNMARAREMLSFGLPLIIAGLGSMIVQVADRPLMVKAAGLAAAGIYGTCYKLGIGMMLLVGMFDAAWKPFILERASRPDAGAIVARVLTYFCVIAAWAFLAVAYFIEPLSKAPLFADHSLIHPSFWSGLGVVPIVTLGYALNGVYFVLLGPLLIDRRTKGVAIATWSGASTNIILNLIMIPRYGMMGAAWATFWAYAVMAAVAWQLNRMHRPIPFETRRIFILVAWTALLWWPSANIGLAARIALFASYPIGLFISGFLHAEELLELKTLLKIQRA